MEQTESVQVRNPLLFLRAECKIKGYTLFKPETSGFYPTQEDRAENGGKWEEQLADHRDKLY